jgi:hypothetical protein
LISVGGGLRIQVGLKSTPMVLPNKDGGVAGYVEELLEDGCWICGFNKV